MMYILYRIPRAELVGYSNFLFSRYAFDDRSGNLCPWYFLVNMRDGRVISDDPLYLSGGPYQEVSRLTVAKVCGRMDW